MNQFSDTWLWDGAQWTQQVTPTFPNCYGDFLLQTNGRNNAAFGFDPSRGVATLWGGGCFELKPASGGFYAYQFTGDAEVWELDANGWTSKSASGPAASSGARFAYSPITKRMLLVTASAAEQWEWDGTAWTLFGGTLPQHEALNIATDVERQRIVMHGGYSYYDVDLAEYLDVRYTHEWNGTDWVLVETKVPQRRRCRPMTPSADARSRSLKVERSTNERRPAGSRSVQP